MNKLKIAMVGCGRISQVYRKIFEQLSDTLQVIYAVDVKKDRAEEFAKNFDGCTALTDYRDCFDSHIDIMHIATPHYLHPVIAIDAMKNKINVLTEKPISVELKDADEMIRASRENKVALGVIFQTRYVKGCMELKNIIEKGKIGKILSASSFLTWSRPDDYYKQSDWKGTWDKEGGGVLIDQAIHSIDRVLWLVGDDVEWVEGTVCNRRHKYVNVEDTAEAMVKFKKGCIYNIYACNTYAYDAPIQIEIVGEKGRVGLKQDMAWVCIDGEEYYEIKDGFDGLFVGPDYWGCSHITQLKDFYRSITCNTPVFIDGTEGRKTLEIIKAIYKSSNRKAIVELPIY